MRSNLKLLILTIVLLNCLAVLAENDTQTSPPLKEAFVILRDPSLGKPRLTLRTPPKDTNGRQADDIMEQFLIHVREGQVSEAKQLCRFEVLAYITSDRFGSVTKHNLPSNSEYKKQAEEQLAASAALFPRYIEELQKATRYIIGATVKQKSNYWTITVVAEDIKEQFWPQSQNIYLYYQNGKWEILISDLTRRFKN